MQILIIPSSKNPNNRVQIQHLDQIKGVLKDCQIMEKSPEDEGFREALNSAEVVLTQNLAFVDFKNASKLKWIHMTSAGVNNLSEEIRNSDILLSNSSGVHPVPISEHVLGFMLILTRNFDHFIRSQPKREWSRGGNRVMDELYEKSVCIVGLGQIGERVAKLCGGFEMKVSGIVRDPKSERNYVDSLFGLENLESVLAESDFVINCLPGTEETKQLFDKEKFSKFKKGSFFINIGRGSTVNENDLIDALKDGTLRGAGLDVFETEPLVQTSPLWEMENVIITPHVSGWSPNSGDRMIEIFCQNLEAYLKHEDLPNLVDKNLGY